MDTVLVLALHAALYATLPLIFAAVSSTMRLALLYVHLGIVLTVGGYLSQVYAVPLWGDVQLGGGNIAYGAFMMTAVLLVIVGRDLQVVRNIVKLVIAVNLFKFGLVELVA